MNKFLLILIASFLFINGWDFDNHKNLIETLYYSINVSYLNLSLLKEGSIVPDKIFKDHRHHNYPDAYYRALNWLNKTKYYLKKNNYNNASYSFGIASHYIADSFSAPHYIKKEPYGLHLKYEKSARLKDVECIYKNYDLNESLSEGVKEGETLDDWLETKDNEISSDALTKSYKILLNVALDLFNTTCLNKKTKFEEDYFDINLKQMTLMIIILGIIIYLLISILNSY